MNDESQRTDAFIDEALASYPQRPLPPEFVHRVMTQIEAQPHAQPERFRLQFLDLALTLCFGGMVTLVMLTIFATFGIVDFDWMAVNTLDLLELFNNLSPSIRFWLILGIILFAELGLAAGVCIQLWQDRPYTAA